MKKLLQYILLLLCATGFAQINFEPGYFIDNTGTKTEALIKNVAWKNNPVSFEYKLSGQDAVQKGDINYVTEFEVSGYKFIRFKTEIERSSTNITYLKDYPSPDFKTETIFLKLLVSGEINLYSYEDGNMIKYFVSTADNPVPFQLLFIVYEDKTSTNGNYGSHVREVNTFRQQLYKLMVSKGYKMEDFTKLEYKKAPLTKLIVKYNANGQEPSNDLTERQNKSSFNFKITPGAHIASIKVDNPELDQDQVQHSFGSMGTVSLGVEGEYILPFNNNKWSLFVNPSIQFIDKNERAPLYNYPDRMYGWKVRYHFIEIPVGLRYYMFLNEKNRVFVNAAIVLVPNLGDNYILRRRADRLDIESTTNMVIGGGYSFNKRYSAEIRYTFNRQTMDYLYWSGKYSSIGVVLGYKLF